MHYLKGKTKPAEGKLVEEKLKNKINNKLKNLKKMEIIKKTMLLKTLILLTGIQCYGQALKVDNKGTTTFNPDGTGHNLIIKAAKEGDYNEPILMPSSTNWGYIRN